MIQFFPAEGRSATGVIRPDGTYCVTTFEKDDGAVLGMHRVTVEAFQSPDAAAARPQEATHLGRPGFAPVVSAGRAQWIVPEKYSMPANSPLTAEVEPGDNTIDFNLPAE